jgi:hypothetical protein
VIAIDVVTGAVVTLIGAPQDPTVVMYGQCERVLADVVLQPIELFGLCSLNVGRGEHQVVPNLVAHEAVVIEGDA